MPSSINSEKEELPTTARNLRHSLMSVLAGSSFNHHHSSESFMRNEPKLSNKEYTINKIEGHWRERCFMGYDCLQATNYIQNIYIPANSSMKIKVVLICVKF
ncbi:hypothetical protein L1887_33691 [Cichorium endivia]|nr:hypothetical protein L1887_33691 [Cichorium endivia]